MKPNANLLEFGEALQKEMDKVLADLPVGVGVHLVSDQPVIVEEAVSGFTARAVRGGRHRARRVSFVSLGMRAGFVVALSIPLVLAITFMVMAYLGISLQRISLGALIIALGLLVDDAMIAVEMMVARLEVGDNLRKAATYVYTSTAFPMLTGTLVTVAGFIPIGLNNSAAGEYTFTLFVVIAVSLLVSWIVAVLFTPLLGVTILPATMKTSMHDQPGRFTALFRRVLVGSACAVTGLPSSPRVLLFAGSIVRLGLVQQQFFPPSDRPELIVDWNLPQNSSIAETRDQIERFEQRALAGNPDIDHFSSYIGQGAVRFVLAFDVQPANPYLRPDRHRHQEHRGPQPGQAAAGEAAARGVRRHRRLRQAARTRAAGRPAGAVPRRRARHPDGARAGAAVRRRHLAPTRSSAAPTSTGTSRSACCKVDVLQDKARQLGITSSRHRQRAEQHGRRRHHHPGARRHLSVNVVARAREAERGSIETLQNMQLPTATGEADPARRASPTSATSSNSRRSGGATASRPITVRAGLVGDVQPATVVNELQAVGRRLHRQAAAGLFDRRSPARSRKAPRARGRSPPWCR